MCEPTWALTELRKEQSPSGATTRLPKASESTLLPLSPSVNWSVCVSMAWLRSYCICHPDWGCCQVEWLNLWVWGKDVKFLLLNSAVSLKLLLEINLAWHIGTHLECQHLGNGGRRVKPDQLQSEWEANLSYMRSCFKNKMRARKRVVYKVLAASCMKAWVQIAPYDYNPTRKRQRQVDSLGLAGHLIQEINWVHWENLSYKIKWKTMQEDTQHWPDCHTYP